MTVEQHLEAWLGAWPPPVPGRVCFVGSERRTQPGWDGRVRAVMAVGAPELGVVVSVRPDVAARLPSSVADMAGAGRLLGAEIWDAAFRWCDQPADLPDMGEWVPPPDERVPEWLKPFNDDVLVCFDSDGQYLAGVGLKQHDEFGWEISVGTEPAAQGRGLARGLVATAARRVIAEGKVPTYLHDFRNTASAKVAEAAGFPDRGWKVYGLSNTG